MHHRTARAPLTLALLIALALSGCGQPAGARRVDPSAAPARPTAVILAADRGLDEHAAAGLYAAVGIALHDGSVAAYDSQYHYLVERPADWLRAEQRGWAPRGYVPSRPSYPSATAVMSGAARSVLVARFPDETERLSQLADDAARAGLLTGADWPQDGQAGLELGGEVFMLLYLRLLEGQWAAPTGGRP